MIIRLGENSNLWTPFFRLIIRAFMAWCFEWKVFAAEPSFGIPTTNVTFVEGETAILECSILHLTEDHNVAWTDAYGFPLTLNSKRLIDDKRMSVERPLERLWNLHIRDVRYSDRGKYICQISTSPEKHKDVILNVIVPPVIIEQYSSTDMTVQEGDKVTIVCNATGVPQPEISWFRFLDDPMQQREKIGTTGEVLIIHNVSRECGGTYVCEAENGVEPSQSREINLVVQYPPEVFLPSARLGQHPGRETFLQCEVTANPHGTMFWERDGHDLIADISGKFNVEIFDTDFEQRKILSLRIREIKNEDFGQYTCVADNFVGEDKETMILYDYSIHMRRSTTTTASSIIVMPDETERWLPPESRPEYNSGRRKHFNDENNENVGAIRGKGGSNHLFIPVNYISVIVLVNYWTVFNMLTS